MLESLKTDVLNILKTDLTARASDDVLYSEILKAKGFGGLSIAEFFARRKELGAPSFESVRRTRQKLQEENDQYRSLVLTIVSTPPTLSKTKRGDDQSKRRRRKDIQEFRKWLNTEIRKS